VKHLIKYKIFESKNQTTYNSRKILEEYFEFNLEDIQDFIQDILDDYPELDWEVIFPTQSKDVFCINFFKNRLNQRDNILPGYYPITKESIDFLNRNLLNYNCKIKPMKYNDCFDEMIGYSDKGLYLTITICKL
jgi:hypothetical protein